MTTSTPTDKYLRNLLLDLFYVMRHNRECREIVQSYLDKCEVEELLNTGSTIQQKESDCSCCSESTKHDEGAIELSSLQEKTLETISSIKDDLGKDSE